MGMTASRRRIWTIGFLSGAAFLLLSGFVIFNAFQMRSLSPSSIEQILVFTGLSAVGFLLFVLVSVLLVRNVLRLYAEQRSRVLGTRLRTRMLWGAVLVSLVPIAFMFAFSYGLLNRSVDRWFSQPVTQMRDDANRMATELASYTTANARVEADSIAASLPGIRLTEDEAAGAAAGFVAAPMKVAKRERQPSAGAGRKKEVPVTKAGSENLEAINRILRQHETTLQGGFVLVYREGRAVASYHMPALAGSASLLEPKQWHSLAEADDEGEAGRTFGAGPAEAARTLGGAGQTNEAAILETAERTDGPILSIGQTDYALGTAGMKGGGTVVAALPLPYGLASTMARMRISTAAYWTLYSGRRQLRILYVILLSLMTCLALFASSWLALHLSKQVTKPVESLADAMGAVAAGDYGRRVAESTTDELGELIRSFNHMAGDLESSRAQVQRTTRELSAMNSTLEARRSELETMLETIPNGVATLDASGCIVLTNRALSEMLDPGGQRRFIGREIHEVFPAEMMESLERLMRRSHRMGSASGEMEMSSSLGGGRNGASDGHGGTLGGNSAMMHLLVTVALLEGGTERTHLGYVLVLENATELLRAQKQSAWKEVARRVAHEIKNPLTPISLSAEQIYRHVGRLSETMAIHEVESPSIGVIRRCSEVITSSVESMRGLVDQFAALAEFPTAKPRPSDLNTIVENSLAVFAGRLQSIKLVRRMAADLPLVMADPEAMKRALGNLIDNAAEAMQQSLLREMRIETRLLPNGMVELVVADTGNGLTDEMRERLFLPYFSTKERGTGLGLAIAAKIIQEHQGTIRAEANVPAGAKFIVELKSASLVDAGDTVRAAVPVGGSA